jgi:hypothetical protein
MTKLVICAAALGLALSNAAQAKGCIKGAIVGGGGRSYGRSWENRRCRRLRHWSSTNKSDSQKAAATVGPEDDLFREMAGASIRPELIAAKLNRSVRAIKARAGAIGLPLKGEGGMSELGGSHR